MSRSNYIISMMHSFSTKDYENFINDCYDLIKFEETKGNFKLAMKMRDALEKPLPTVGNGRLSKSALSLTPIDAPINTKPFSNSNQINNEDDFFELKESTIKLNQVVLEKQTLNSINDVIHQWKNTEKLANYNLVPQSKLLFYGQPGTGKTFTAHAIANELNLQVLYMNFDSLVSSFLGKTGSNLGRIFKYANKRPCLLLIDELDAIGKKRDDSQELGELKRIVISLLQNLDNISSRSLVVACTNHEHLLDRALWRRFDSMIEFKIPSEKERIKIVEQTLIDRRMKLDNYWIQNIGAVTRGFSPSNIIKAVENGIRRWVLNSDKESQVYLIIIEEVIKLLDLDQLSMQEKIEVAKTLRNGSRIYTLSYLSNLMDIPKSTLHKKLKGDDNNYE